jgi:pimeloyl-ACP methyl ester carboxylesterase
VNEHDVDCGGLRLSVRDRAGGSPAILALHGLASNARWWDLVGARLSPQWRVLAPDLRGHGRSDKPDSGYSFPEIVEDLRGLCATEGLDRVIVAGHSWGASVALWFAAALPERVLGCVCVDGGAGDLRAHISGGWAEAEERMRPPAFTGLTEAGVRAWVASGPLAQSGDARTAADMVLGNFEGDTDGTLRPRLRLHRHMEIARQLYELDSFELMGQVRCPVLFLPARDPQAAWAPAAKMEALERARAVLGERAAVVWIDGVHDLPVQRPAEVAGAIAEFSVGLATRLFHPD